MAFLKARVVGAERVQSTLLSFRNGVRERLIRVMAEIAADLVARVKARAPHKRGTLANSVRGKPVEKQNYVGGRIYVGGKRAPYAHLMEKGWQGEEEVKAHVRRCKANNVKAKVETSKGLRLRKVAAGIAFVKAYKRPVSYKSLNYAHGALDEMRGEIRQRIVNAIRGK